MHSFYQLDDGSNIAFFEAPDREFSFTRQHDYDLHLALEVSMENLHDMFEKGQKAGIETRGFLITVLFLLSISATRMAMW